jgi:hypothetical protein
MSCFVVGLVLWERGTPSQCVQQNQHQPLLSLFGRKSGRDGTQNRGSIRLGDKPGTTQFLDNPAAFFRTDPLSGAMPILNECFGLWVLKKSALFLGFRGLNSVVEFVGIAVGPMK